METGPATKPPWASVQWQPRIFSPLKQLSFGEWCDKHPSILRTAKDRISALEEIHRWELVKKMVNPYEMVYTHEDNNFHPSIAVIKPLSRSYFKLIEILPFSHTVHSSYGYYHKRTNSNAQFKLYDTKNNDINKYEFIESNLVKPERILKCKKIILLPSDKTSSINNAVVPIFPPKSIMFVFGL
jgi:hypothetical protein